MPPLIHHRQTATPGGEVIKSIRGDEGQNFVGSEEVWPWLVI